MYATSLRCLSTYCCSSCLLLLQICPRWFGWPGIEVTMLGATFKWNILGYDAEHGGLPYFCAYMIAMILGEVINFPIQRNVVFRSKGNLTWQIVWYAVAFCVITCIVNSINCLGRNSCADMCRILFTILVQRY